MADGSRAYVIISNVRIEEVEIVKKDRDRVIVRYGDCGSGMCIRRNRLYASRQEAERHLPYKQKKQAAKRGGYASPYDYE